VRRLDDFAINADVALLDEALHRAARDGWKFRPQKNVKSLGGQRLFDGEMFRARGHEFLIRRRLRRVLVFPGDEEN
jgi:hypothetical protein